jgi:hypothetical protein
MLVACGQASTVADVQPSLSCTVQYTGHGIDTLNYSIACRIAGPSGARAYTLTGTSSDDPLAQYTWCANDPLASGRVATCSGMLVVVAPRQLHTVTVTAAFTPGNEHVHTVVTVPSPSS